MSFTLFGGLRELDDGRYRAELYRAWAVGMSAGFASPLALEQIGPMDSPRVDEVRRYLMIGFRQDKSLGTLVKARPNMFAPFEAAILAAGEESGTLDLSFRLLSDHFTRDYKRTLKVRGLLGYPIFVGLVAAFGATIPFLHRGGIRAYLLAIGGSIAALLLLGGVPVGILAAMLAAQPTYSLPRFARALAIGAEAGLPLGRLVRLAVDASDNPELKRHIARRSERQLSITPMAVVFEGCRAIPPAMLAQMKIADATGDYANTLKRYADLLEDSK